MTTLAAGAAEPRSAMHAVYGAAYRAFAFFGLFTLFAMPLWGFRYEAEGVPASNWAFDAALYAAFIVPHLVMTRSWFKKAVWRRPEGHPRERRFYIFVTVITWFAVIGLHRPLSGGMVHYPEQWAGEIRFVGIVFFLIFMKLFFEGVPNAAIDGLLGVPGKVSAFSHGPETPLFTEGRYAQVRHPMYQAVLLALLASLIIHPHVAQLFWGGLVGGTFVLFSPIEERQLLRARGDDYLEYKKQTRWRLFRGIY